MNPIILLVIFVVATLVGYKLINNVPSLLHTPLMSGMNALSGVTVLGALTATAASVATGNKILGVLAIFLVKDEPGLKRGSDSYFKNLLYGFRPSVVKENPELYLSFAAFCLFSVAVQVFFPYLIIYIQNYLGITDYAIVLGVVLILASVVSVVSGRFIDRLGKLRFVFPAAAVMLAGLVGMFFVRGSAGVMIAGTVMMSGYMMMTSALGANIRDWTPAGKAGHFQGIRMIFAVLLPMVTGPAIGAAVIKNGASTYVELGQVKTVPTPGIYLAAAAVLLLTFVPILVLRRKKQ